MSVHLFDRLLEFLRLTLHMLATLLKTHLLFLVSGEILDRFGCSSFDFLDRNYLLLLRL